MDSKLSFSNITMNRNCKILLWFSQSVKGYQNYPVVFTIYNDPYGNLEMLSDDEDDGAFLIYESKSSGLE